MFVITSKETNEIMGYGVNLSYQSNGYPLLVEERTAFVKENVDVCEVETIPDGIVEGKYCYTEADGFYLNPEWTEPEQLYTLDEAAQIIASEVNA